MSAFTVTKAVEFQQEMTESQILNAIRECLKKEFDGVKIRQRKNKKTSLRCRVRTNWMNPIVSLGGPIDIQVKGNKAKIMIDADAKTNMWFWVTFLLSGWLIFPLLLIMFMWGSQKKKSMAALNKSLERLDFEHGTF